MLAGMTDTPSGNRWEPTDDDTAPVGAVPPTPVETPGSETPAEPMAPAYGWGPERTAEPHSADASPSRRPTGRRTGALAAGAAALALAAGAGGYALGAAAAGPDGPGVGTTRQGPPAGFAPGEGFPGHDGGDHDHVGGPDDGGESGTG